MLSLRLLLQLSTILLLILPCEAKIKNDTPLIWDLSQTEQMRANRGSNQEAYNILQRAERYIKTIPVSVTDKKKLTFEPNEHYYCSMGTYWWPDSLHKGKYINKDGVSNPESKEYDNARLSTLVCRCKVLSQAYYISNERKYYDTFVKQLRVWFIEKSTCMFPTFEYAQVVPGQNENKGRSTGLIDAYTFNDLIESIRLVNGVNRIDRWTMKGLQRWFLAFANDSEGRYGEKFRSVNNNISLAFDVTMANMYLFAGNEKKAKEIVDKFAVLRIEKQIFEDGSQPVELKRTRAFSYSLFNLTHIVDMCYLARCWYPNYYQEHHERIDIAFEYLGQYIKEPEKFPYQQITDWDGCKKDYQQQFERIYILKTNGNN